MEPWIQQAMVAHSPLTLPSGSVPTVSPFKYVIVLALSIRKNSPYLNKKKSKKKTKPTETEHALSGCVSLDSLI